MFPILTGCCGSNCHPGELKLPHPYAKDRVDDHAQAASPEEVAAIEQATGVSMQLISIRMPTDLLRVLKEIAKYHGIGYQPMIRDLLDRWAVGEIKTILNKRLGKTNERETEQKASAPLAGDLRRRT